MTTFFCVPDSIFFFLSFLQNFSDYSWGNHFLSPNYIKGVSILNANESEAAHAKNGWFGFELFNELLQLRFLRFGVGCSHCCLEPLILSHSIINADIEIQKPYHFSNACNVYSQSSWPTLFPTPSTLGYSIFDTVLGTLSHTPVFPCLQLLSWWGNLVKDLVD